MNLERFYLLLNLKFHKSCSRILSTHLLTKNWISTIFDFSKCIGSFIEKWTLKTRETFFIRFSFFDPNFAWTIKNFKSFQNSIKILLLIFPFSTGFYQVSCMLHKSLCKTLAQMLKGKPSNYSLLSNWSSCNVFGKAKTEVE